ncbi:CCA tRNA nucleotidyltransferase [Paracoccus suum]|uniref:CCA tRNA nucleotidyltransferase n=2 Tax=Paracoccus suum TaxID=2259340 RepID=A0A344PNM9_9RHOB|nr:CCA tRNA nucleotidyltransferase [Paracoccus suum]
MLPKAVIADPALQSVLSLLTSAGHQALIVGGAVRDALLGLEVRDIDIATSAAPDVVVALAREAGIRSVPTGIEHGTVTLIACGRHFEVTSFRRDVATDGRHATVAYTADLAEDAARRDFTMNALYADAAGAVLDPTGSGLSDLAARRLRFVGDASARITEDYLRALRFFRFHAHYGAPGRADPEALAATAAHAPGLQTLSRERVGAEVRRLLDAPDPTEALRLMAQTGVLAAVLPSADPASMPALVAAEAALGVTPDWQRRLALLAPELPPEALRLSRSEASRHARLAKASQIRPFRIDPAGYHLGAGDGRDAALIAQANGANLPAGWPQRLAEASAAPLPIAAADIAPPLAGPAIGRGLRAAEALWIESGFAIPAPALIDAALLAGDEDR